MLWGLDPNGLSDFNALVGHNHVLRRFERERVLLSYPTDALASGLTLRDVVMDTGQKMYGWMALKTPDEDAFDWLVDHTDIAPFCRFPDGLEMGKETAHPGGDHEPRNMVNGFTSDDNWVFTYTTIMDKGHKRKFTLALPKEEEITALKIRPSKLYHPITKIKLTFDDDPTPVVAQLPVRENPIVEDIPIPGRRAKQVTLEIAEWTERGNANIVVIDNLWLQVKRSEAYQKHVTSLLNVGALMAYRKGAGGIFLNQLKVADQEVNPDNAIKKATIVKTVLKNMGAVFAGGQTRVERTAYLSEPVVIQDSLFNAFVHQRGNPPWFDGGDISALPVGQRQYAGIDFFLSDFSTSPVPTVFMLSGSGSRTKQSRITNIPVGQKADALFFLHTFHKGPDITRWEQRTEEARKRNRDRPEPLPAFKYVVQYDDGSQVEVPVIYQQHVGHWSTEQALPLEGADLAWTGKQPDGRQAAVWVMTWTNPQPDKTVTKIDIARTGANRGAGAVFAISVGKAR